MTWMLNPLTLRKCGPVVAASAVVTCAIGLLAPPAARADYTVDDTEVFFNQTSGAKTNPNILFILPTGATMGCAFGSSSPCATALPSTDDTSRMNKMKDALVKMIDTIYANGIGVNIGLMRGNNNGSDGSNAAKGGMIVQEVGPLTSTKVDQLKRWICPYDSPVGYCNYVKPNSGNGQEQAFVPSNDASLSKLGSGRQQLTEILFEANRYYASRGVVWASNGGIGPSYPFPGKSYTPSVIWGPATQVPGNCPGQNCIYKTPIAAPACQKNYIVILSDGVFASDTGNDTGAQSIANSAGDPSPYNKWFKVYQDSFQLVQGGPTYSYTSGINKNGCSVNSGINYTARQLSDCSDDLVYSMRNGGFVNGLPTATVSTYTVGFDITAATTADGSPTDAPKKLLQMLSRAGGGKYYDVTGPDQLVDDLLKIVNEAVLANASFTSPAVSVNSFNRTQNLNELYMSVFRPSSDLRWNGNIKKYRLAANGDIKGLDSSGAEVLAVDSLQGTFVPNVSDLWGPSGNSTGQEDVLQGGAAHKLPDPTTRNVYMNDGGANSVSSLALDSIDLLNTNLNAATILGYTAQSLVPPLCPVPSSTKADLTNPAVCQLVNWIRGMDVADVLPTGDPANGIPDGNGNTTEARYDLGDPLHTRPAVVIYGGSPSTPNINDALVFGVDNYGMLHAIDPSTGVEQWSFVPWDRLGRMLKLYQNPYSNPRATLGLDGTIRVFKLDKNGDGIIDPSVGDRVYLYFGMRRGGRYMYGMDVTDKTKPKLMWIVGPNGDSYITSTTRQLYKLGQTWSRPVVTRMKVPGYSNSNNPDNYVLIFGGGYDPTTEDVSSPQAYVNDTMGMGVYMIDAISGQLIWRAGPDSGADLQLTGMTNAIPADVAVLDLTGDGYVDLAYVGDLGGHVWRFEFNQSATQKSSMITGGMFANLGGSGASEARRFFVQPDVSFVTDGTTSWYNVSIGSGNREMPITDQTTNNRLYSLRDKNKLIPYSWGSTPPLTEADLVDISAGTAPVSSTNPTGQASVPATASGWYLRLTSYPGEKVISASRTFDNTIFAPSFVPQKRSEDTDNNLCTDAIGYNNLYEISVFDGKPSSKYLDATTHNVVAGGLAIRLQQFGIAPEAVFLFPGADSGGTDATRPPPVCLIGTESCGQFSSFEPKRTYWRQKGAE